MPSDIVNTLKTLGDETRLRIIHLIDQCGPDICVCDMVAVLDLPQSTISRQLMRLRHTGFVSDSRDGMWINYAMSTVENPVRDSLLNALRQVWAIDAIFTADKAKFHQLHAEHKIVRCRRQSSNPDNQADVQL